MDLIKRGDKWIRENNSYMISHRWGIGAKLSKLVFALRMRKGMTQAEFATALNVEPSVVHSIDGGVKDITIGMYEEALFALGLSYDDMDALINLEKEPIGITDGKDVPTLLAEIERLKSQLDELSESVYEHCNAFSPPYCKAESIERVNGN